MMIHAEEEISDSETIRQTEHAFIGPARAIVEHGVVAVDANVESSSSEETERYNAGTPDDFMLDDEEELTRDDDNEVKLNHALDWLASADYSGRRSSHRLQPQL